MAVGRRPKLTLPILARINFFHKTDPLLILILCKKQLKNFQIGPLWADWQTPQFVQNGPQYGAPNTYERG